MALKITNTQHKFVQTDSESFISIEFISDNRIECKKLSQSKLYSTLPKLIGKTKTFSNFVKIEAIKIETRGKLEHNQIMLGE